MVKLHSLNPGDKVLVKVGRNLISCEVVEVRPDRAVVKSDSTGKEFKTMKVEELVSRAGGVVAEAMEYVAERVAEAVAPQVAAQVAAMPELAAEVADVAVPAEEPPAEEPPAEEPPAEEPSAEPAQNAPKPQKKLSLVNAGIEVMKQLDGDEEGYLAVYCLEKMSPAFSGIKLNSLVQNLLGKMGSTQNRETFLSKLQLYNYDFSTEYDNYVFTNVGFSMYSVGAGFPRLCRKNIQTAINKIQYEIFLSELEGFKL